MKILVVDDERDIQRLFEQRFRKERRSGQISFYFAFSGEEALKFLEQEDIGDLHFILSDINMPNMNGLELLSIIRANYPELKVYMITAYGDDKKRQEAIRNGAEGYLVKPLDFNKLKEAIKADTEE